MLDFFTIKTEIKNNEIIIEPEFNNGFVKDVMVRGGNFYAIWDEKEERWNTNPREVVKIIDEELYSYAKKNFPSQRCTIKTMKNNGSGKWNEFVKYIRNSPDNFVMLDSSVTFANTKTKKDDYASKRLDYELKEGPIEAYNKLVGTLYKPEERDKIEWAIGSIVAGDSKDIQKFMVFYGDPGSGKGTMLDIIDSLFEPYSIAFNAKDLGSSSRQFATEPFKNNPLVAINADGNLSKIEDNTTLNSIISHDKITMNGKYERVYTGRTIAMLFIASNDPVKITDGKSGILRRLIDVNPSGEKIPPKEFQRLKSQIKFEKGAIAYHCLQVYKDLGKDYYMGYRPLSMIYKTNAFYNFVENYYDMFVEKDGITLQDAWTLYQAYATDTAMEFKMPMYRVREELKNYFDKFELRARVDGKQVRSYYSGFKKSKFAYDDSYKDFEKIEPDTGWLNFKEQKSLFDEAFKDYPAQYDAGGEKSRPKTYWDACESILSEIDTTKLHWVKPPVHLVCVDFDIKDENGNKSFELNVEAASKFPPTYAELSKSGGGIHLYYIYEGDVSLLSHLYSNDIEIKTFPGNSSLRRKLTKCNDIPVATIKSGLPLREEKGDKKVLNFEAVRSETALRRMIERNLNKEIHDNTTQSINFIKKILDDAYENGTLSYDVSDMRHQIYAFASKASNQSDRCLKTVGEMHFVSRDVEERINKGLDILSEKNIQDDRPLTFFDIEIYPNLFLICYETEGQNKIAMVNPTVEELVEFIKLKLVGFNCIRYDNHIVYGGLLGYDNYNLFLLSQNIISGVKNSGFSKSRSVSYTDVYDFCSKKQSLKKWEIELGIHHQECPYKWDEPVPEDKWPEIIEYCFNDVEATKQVFYANRGDFKAREILADLAEMTPNDTTNNLTTKIIFGSNRTPDLHYTNLSTGEEYNSRNELVGVQDAKFPEYNWEQLADGRWHNMYRGVDLGLGGYVYAEPGMYYDVTLLDVASLHPHSMKAMNIFGNDTKRFTDLMDARLYIKHKDFESAKKLFNGKLAKYLDDPSEAKALSKALKIAINSVYGLTSAKFDNPFRDKRNVNNIVALRGALFMKTLQDEVTSRGYKVVHIKTDSIKIPIQGADQKIVDFCMDFAKQYGYSFEHEATYERMCLVNDAVYIAKYMRPEECKKKHGYVPSANADHFESHKHPWTATGAQFQHPYVFKYLFSKEPIEYNDMCETKSVQTALYLDMNEGLQDVTAEEKEYEKLRKLKSDDPEVLSRMDILKAEIEKGHKYVFIGKTGLFNPIKKGLGGGLLMREKDGKYSAATGTKGYRWLESEYVKEQHKEDDVDISYFAALVDDAIDTINKFGDFNEFVAEPEIHFSLQSDELPF